MRNLGIKLLFIASFYSAIPATSLAQSYSTGLEFLPADKYQSIPLAPTPQIDYLPESQDLSPKFPAPGSQGSIGTCVGWTLAYLKSYQEGLERSWDFTQNHQRISPSYIYNSIRSSNMCDGAYIADGLNLLIQEGASTEDLMPISTSNCQLTPPPAAKKDASQYRIATWTRINYLNINEVKTYIALGIPVVIGYQSTPTFQSYRGGVYKSVSTDHASGHAMLVVGYDDSRQAVKVLNSWGSDWGEQGFGWIDYSVFSHKTREAYVSQDITYDPKSDLIRKNDRRFVVSGKPYGPSLSGLQLGMTENEFLSWAEGKGIKLNKSENTTMSFWISSKKSFEQLNATRYDFKAPENSHANSFHSPSYDVHIDHDYKNVIEISIQLFSDTSMQFESFWDVFRKEKKGIAYKTDIPTGTFRNSISKAINYTRVSSLTSASEYGILPEAEYSSAGIPKSIKSQLEEVKPIEPLHNESALQCRKLLSAWVGETNQEKYWSPATETHFSIAQESGKGYGTPVKLHNSISQNNTNEQAEFTFSTKMSTSIDFRIWGPHQTKKVPKHVSVKNNSYFVEPPTRALSVCRLKAQSRLKISDSEQPTKENVLGF